MGRPLSGRKLKFRGNLMVESKSNRPFAPLVIDLPLDRNEYFRILDEQKAVTMRSGLVALKPGEEVGSHNTENYEECVIILEGNGEIESAGLSRRKIGYGQVAYNPPQTQHNIINTGDKPLRYIYIVAKAIS